MIWDVFDGLETAGCLADLFGDSTEGRSEAEASRTSRRERLLKGLGHLDALELFDRGHGSIAYHARTHRFGIAFAGSPVVLFGPAEVARLDVSTSDDACLRLHLDLMTGPKSYSLKFKSRKIAERWRTLMAAGRTSPVPSP